MHDEKPIRRESSDEVNQKVEQIRASDYCRYVQGLAPFVRGKIVQQGRAGTSGFILRFTDGSWVASYLEKAELRYEIGRTAIPEEVLAMINSPTTGDGAEPLSVDLPYAGEPCNIAKEVSRCEGKQVVGLAYGADCFNFCFPQRRELETMILPANDGRPALRVFWEQW